MKQEVIRVTTLILLYVVFCFVGSCMLKQKNIPISGCEIKK